MRIALTVHDPDDYRALKFAAAAIDSGHQIPLVFFYHDGVYAADEDSATAEACQAFARQHDVPLAVCIGAAARRALVDESAPQNGRIPPGFEVVGLGQFIGALVESDRLITFAG